MKSATIRMMAARQFLRKKLHILRGWWRSRFEPNSAYLHNWWDAEFYSGEITDRNTIWSQRGLVQTSLHYVSIESIILPALQGRLMKRVIDIGSGAGHWIKFYRQFGADVAGCDVSEKCIHHLRSIGLNVEHGTAETTLPLLGSADIVNAIGVMFHLVDDDEWERTIHLVGSALTPGGVFIVGGHFGWLDGVNIQIGGDGSVNKRLRSAKHWRRVLREAGFHGVHIVRNRTYLRSTEPLPENNILFAYK